MVSFNRVDRKRARSGGCVATMKSHASWALAASRYEQIEHERERLFGQAHCLARSAFAESVRR